VVLVNPMLWVYQASKQKQSLALIWMMAFLEKKIGENMKTSVWSKWWFVVVVGNIIV